jgi:hypothetical protein
MNNNLSKIIFLKENLKKIGLFDNKTINTLKQSILKKCNMCEQLRGSIGKLDNCFKNNIICLECIDILYDNYHLVNKDDILFKCLCCNNDIKDYDII